MRVPLRSVGCAVAALLVAVTLMACTSSTARRFEVNLHAPDGSYPLKVAFLDDTGLVIGVEPGDERGAFDLEPKVERDAVDPKIILVSWLGGACTDDVSLYFVRIDTGFALSLRAGRPLFASCTAIGLLRSVRVQLSEPIDVTTIQVSGHE